MICAVVVRLENLATAVPVTRKEFCKWFTEECPEYVRPLLNPTYAVVNCSLGVVSRATLRTASLGLSAKASDLRFDALLKDRSVMKDQVPSNDLQGNDTGYAPRTFILMLGMISWLLLGAADSR